MLDLAFLFRAIPDEELEVDADLVDDLEVDGDLVDDLEVDGDLVNDLEVDPAERSEEPEADLLEDLEADEELEEDLDEEHEADEELEEDLDEEHKADEVETSACAPYLAPQMSCLGSQTPGVKDTPFLVRYGARRRLRNVFLLGASSTLEIYVLTS